MANPFGSDKNGAGLGTTELFCYKKAISNPNFDDSLFQISKQVR
jgi:hypothetical protein